ncbi:hypothetical protein [Micromonospora deserti]|nr:hypothetical protein [Micromonospora deserti]
MSVAAGDAFTAGLLDALVEVGAAIPAAGWPRTGCARCSTGRPWWRR